MRAQQRARRPEIAPVAVLKEAADTGAVVDGPHVGHPVDVALALGREAGDQRGLEHVHAGEMHADESGVGGGTAPRDAADVHVAVHLDGAISRSGRIRSEHHGGDGARLAVSREGGREIDVEHHVAVEEEERSAAQHRLRAPDAASGAEDVLELPRDGEIDAELPRELDRALLHRRGEMMRVDHDRRHTGVLEEREVVSEQRQPAQRHQWLRDLVGERAQARAEPGAEHHRVHSLTCTASSHSRKAAPSCGSGWVTPVPQRRRRRDGAPSAAVGRCVPAGARRDPRRRTPTGTGAGMGGRNRPPCPARTRWRS